MNFKIHLIILIALSAVLSSCTTNQTSSDGRQEVFITDENSGKIGDEVVISDADLKGQSWQNSSGEKNSQEQVIIAEDKSKITTLVDSYGNKTETRCFVNHPRLDCVSVMTPTQGIKEVLVYPVGSAAKKIPEDAAEQALSAPPDDLANLAGVHQTRADIAQKPVSPYIGKKDNGNLRPMSSSEFSVFPKQVSEIPVEQTEEIQVEENNEKTNKQGRTSISKYEVENEK